MNLECLIAEVEKETHLDHREKDADGAKNGLGWCDTRDLLREIQGIDGHVQCGEDTVLRLWSLGSGFHVVETRGGCEKAVRCGGYEEDSETKQR